MIQIYHNPRCSKSREGVKLLEEQGKAFEIIQYLKDVPTEEEFKKLLIKLNIKPIELVRVKEQIWKDNFKGKQLSDGEIIKAMLDYPRLIERPIVINGNKAVIGRPVESILEII